MNEQDNPVSPIVEALIESERREDVYYLERLLVHLGLFEPLQKISRDFGTELDLSDADTASRLWALIGPRIAREHPIFTKKGKGRPKKRGFATDVERHEAVESKRRELMDSSINSIEYNDLSIIKMLIKERHSLFVMVEVAALQNSVSRGKDELRKFREMLRPYLEGQSWFSPDHA